MKLGSLLLFFFLIASMNAHAIEQAQVDALVNSCIATASKDKICNAIVEFKQIGDDAIEVVKTYADLSPREYALLTLANMLIQGRLRFKTKSLIFRNGNDIYDIRKDSFTLGVEVRF